MLGNKDWLHYSLMQWVLGEIFSSLMSLLGLGQIHGYDGWWTVS